MEYEDYSYDDDDCYDEGESLEAELDLLSFEVDEAVRAADTVKARELSQQLLAKAQSAAGYESWQTKALTSMFWIECKAQEADLAAKTLAQLLAAGSKDRLLKTLLNTMQLLSGEALQLSRKLLIECIGGMEAYARAKASVLMLEKAVQEHWETAALILQNIELGFESGAPLSAEDEIIYSWASLKLRPSAEAPKLYALSTKLAALEAGMYGHRLKLAFLKAAVADQLFLDGYYPDSLKLINDALRTLVLEGADPPQLRRAVWTSGLAMALSGLSEEALMLEEWNFMTSDAFRTIRPLAKSLGLRELERLLEHFKQGAWKAVAHLVVSHPHAEVIVREAKKRAIARTLKCYSRISCSDLEQQFSLTTR